jgi:hypothetical protein
VSSAPTPGPWRACTDPNDVPQLLYSGLIAPLFYSRDGYVAVVSDTRDVGGLEECQANARLMAAAPLLKAALEQALEQAEGAFHNSPCGDDDCWIEAACAALDAAEPPAGRGAGGSGQ